MSKVQSTVITMFAELGAAYRIENANGPDLIANVKGRFYAAMERHLIPTEGAEVVEVRRDRFAYGDLSVTFTRADDALLWTGYLEGDNPELELQDWLRSLTEGLAA